MLYGNTINTTKRPRIHIPPPRPLQKLHHINKNTSLLYRRKTTAKKNKWAIPKPVQLSFKNKKSGRSYSKTSQGHHGSPTSENQRRPSCDVREAPNQHDFKDLIIATSHLGKESQLVEGRCGPVYEAILARRPGHQGPRQC